MRGGFSLAAQLVVLALAARVAAAQSDDTAEATSAEGPAPAQGVPLIVSELLELERNDALRVHTGFGGGAGFAGLAPVNPVGRLPVVDLIDTSQKACVGDNADAADCRAYEPQYVTAGCSARYSSAAPGVGCGDWADACQAESDSGCQDQTPGPGDVNLVGIAPHPRERYLATLSAASAPCVDEEAQLCNRGNTTVGKVLVVDADAHLTRHGTAAAPAAASGVQHRLLFDLDHTPARDSTARYLGLEDANEVSVSPWTGRVPFLHDPSNASSRVYTASSAAPFARLAAISMETGDDELVDAGLAGDLAPVGESVWSSGAPLATERMATLSAPLLQVSSPGGAAAAPLLGEAHEDFATSDTADVDGLYAATIVRGKHKDASDLVNPLFQSLRGQTWSDTITGELRLPTGDASGCSEQPVSADPWVAIVHQTPTECRRDCQVGGYECESYNCVEGGFECGADIASEDYFCREFKCARPVCLLRPCAQWNSDQTYCYRFEETGCDLESDTQCEADWEVCDQNLRRPAECCDFDFVCERLTRADELCDAACTDWEKSFPNACDDPEVLASVCGGESLRRCPNDCACVVDGFCDADAGENFANCAVDCLCNSDGTCDAPRENYANCNADCVCFPDGFCSGAENFANCPADCPCDFDGVCGDTRVPPPDTWYPPESHENCPSDCPCNDDGVCDAENGETLRACPDENCQVACNDDGVCSPNESCETCDDCVGEAECCGSVEETDVCKLDGVCDSEEGEDAYNCAQDCTASTAEAQVRLQLDIKEYPAGSSARQALVDAFVADMAAALGIDPARIVVQSITAGSVVFGVAIQGTDDLAQPSASHLVNTLALQVATPNSAFWEGEVTANADPEFPTAVPEDDGDVIVDDVMLCQTTAQSAIVSTAKDRAKTPFQDLVVGDVFRVVCPWRCAEKVSADVYGSGIYTDDSSICRAAVHEGLVDGVTGGAVEVHIEESPDSFEAAEANGVATVAWGASVARAFSVHAVCELDGVCESDACDPFVRGLLKRDECDAAVLQACEVCDFARDNLTATDATCLELNIALIENADDFNPSAVCWSDCWIRMVEATYQSCLNDCESVPSWFRMGVPAEGEGSAVCDAWRAHLDFACQINYNSQTFEGHYCGHFGDVLDSLEIAAGTGEDDVVLGCDQIQPYGCCAESAMDVLSVLAESSDEEYGGAWSIAKDKLKDALTALENDAECDIPGSGCPTSLVRFDPGVDGVRYADDECAATELSLDFPCRDRGYSDYYGSWYDEDEQPHTLQPGLYSSETFQLTMCHPPSTDWDMAAAVFGSLPNGGVFVASEATAWCQDWYYNPEDPEDSEAETTEGAFKLNIEYQDQDDPGVNRVLRMNWVQVSDNEWDVLYDTPGSCRPLFGEGPEPVRLTYDPDTSHCEEMFPPGGGLEANDGLTPGVSCSGLNIVEAASGAISDGSLAEAPYISNANCVWRVTVPEGQVTVLTFQRFDLEYSGGCYYDWVRVWDSFSRDTQLADLCTSANIPAPIEIHASEFEIEFKSDYTVQNSGFYATWAPRPTVCSGTEALLLGLGTSRTFSDGSDLYENYMDCAWDLEAPAGSVITISFASFHVENSFGCRYDALRVYDDFGGEIAELCGTTYHDVHIMPAVSGPTRAHVVFTSDSSVTYDGFVAHAEAVMYANVAGLPGSVPTQSSGADTAGLAVDGNAARLVDFGSCTSTDAETDPQWSVDLGGEAYVGYVEVLKAEDADLWGASDSFDVLVGSTADIAEATACQLSVPSAPHENTQVWCEMSGSNVFVRVAGSGRALHLCEVRVMSPVRAIHTCAQTADSALDIDGQGYGSGNFGSDSGLEAAYGFMPVADDAPVVNQQPGALTPFLCNRLCEDASTVAGCDVFSAPETSLCAAAVFKFGVEHSYGPFVARMGDVATEYPSCERTGTSTANASPDVSGSSVEIYRAFHHDLVVGAVVSASSEASAAALAADGAFPGEGGSCFASDAEDDPYWHADLLGPRRVQSVRVTNELAGGVQTLTDFAVYVGDVDASAGGVITDNTECGSGLSVELGGAIDVDCAGAVGRHVYIQAAGTGVALRLCEVQVFSSMPETSAVYEVSATHDYGDLENTYEALVDYDIDTGAYSSGSSSGETAVVFDFGEPVSLTGVRLASTELVGADGINGCAVEYSVDGGATWAQAAEVSGFNDGWQVPNYDEITYDDDYYYDEDLVVHAADFTWPAATAQLWRVVRHGTELVALSEAHFAWDVRHARRLTPRRPDDVRRARILAAADDLRLGNPFYLSSVNTRDEPVFVAEECAAIAESPGLDALRNRCPFEVHHSSPCVTAECVSDYCSAACLEIVVEYCQVYSYDAGCDDAVMFADCPVVDLPPEPTVEVEPQKCSPYVERWFYHGAATWTITDNTPNWEDVVYGYDDYGDDWDDDDYYGGDDYYDDDDYYGDDDDYYGGDDGAGGAHRCHPDCPVGWPGDDYCDLDECMHPECDYDGGDCDSVVDDDVPFRCHPDCPVGWPGDDFCDMDECMHPECDYDGGDCDAYVDDDVPLRCHPDCPVGWPGDNFCDMDECMHPECNFDGGDCDSYVDDDAIFRCHPDCPVGWPGDDFCDMDECMHPECNFDGGDCDERRRVSSVVAPETSQRKKSFLKKKHLKTAARKSRFKRREAKRRLTGSTSGSGSDGESPVEQHYSPLSTCMWTLEGPANHQVVVDITRFSTEFHESCKRDAVLLYDKHPYEIDEDTVPQAVLCGELADLEETQIRMPGSRLTVVFHSDISVQSTGFDLDVSFAVPVGPCAGSFFIGTPDGTTSEPLTIGDGSDADVSYNTNSYCDWHIVAGEADSQARVILAFTRLDVEVGSGLCYDWVDVYPTYWASGDPLAFLCADSLDSVDPSLHVLESYDPEMSVYFGSDSADNGQTGWEAVVISQIAGSEVNEWEVAASVEHADTAGSTKDALLDGEPADLSTGVATEVTASGATITLTFAHHVAISGFSLSPMTSFGVDAFNGHVLEYLSAAQQWVQLATLEADSASAAMEFELDTAIVTTQLRVSQGPDNAAIALGDVQLRYLGAVNPYAPCAGTQVLEHDGTPVTISDGSSPNTNYNNGQSCLWQFVAPEGTTLRLEYNRFSLEGGSGCPYDWVALYDDEVSEPWSSTPNVKSCSYTIPADFSSSSNVMTVHFRSDGSVTYSGFEATVYLEDSRRLHAERMTAEQQSKSLRLRHLDPRSPRALQLPGMAQSTRFVSKAIRARGAKWVSEARAAEAAEVEDDARGFGRRFRRLTLTLADLVDVVLTPEEVSVAEGESFELFCNITGAPGAEIAWRRGDPQLVRTLIEGATTDTLVIDDATWEDTDVYFCEAVFPDGSSVPSSLTSVGVTCGNPCDRVCEVYAPVTCPAYQCQEGIPLFLGTDLVPEDDPRRIAALPGPAVCSAVDEVGDPIYPEFVVCNEVSDICGEYACDPAGTCEHGGSWEAAGLSAVPPHGHPFWADIQCENFDDTFSSCTQRDCDITKKVKNAEDSGASAVILVSSSDRVDKAPPLGDSEVTADTSDIPVVAVSRGDGLALTRAAAALEAETGDALEVKLHSPGVTIRDSAVSATFPPDASLEALGVSTTLEALGISATWSDVNELPATSVWQTTITGTVANGCDAGELADVPEDPSAYILLLRLPLAADGTLCPISDWLILVDDEGFAGLLFSVPPEASGALGPGGFVSTTGIGRFVCDRDEGCFTRFDFGCDEYACLESECLEYYCHGEGCCPGDVDDFSCTAVDGNCEAENAGKCRRAPLVFGNDDQWEVSPVSSSFACSPQFYCPQQECVDFACLEHYCQGEGCSENAGAENPDGSFEGGCKSRPDEKWDNEWDNVPCEGLWLGEAIDADHASWHDNDGGVRCYDAPFEPNFGYECLQYGCDEFRCVQAACSSLACTQYKCKQPVCDVFKCSKFVIDEDTDVCDVDSETADCNEYYTIDDWDGESPLAQICEVFSTTECLERYTAADTEVDGGPCEIFDEAGMPDSCLQLDDIGDCDFSPFSHIEDRGSELVGDVLHITGRDIAADCATCDRFDDERQYSGDGLTVRKTWKESCRTLSATRCREFDSTTCVNESPTRCKVWDGYSGAGTWTDTCVVWGPGCYLNGYDFDNCFAPSERCKTRGPTCAELDYDNCVEETEQAVLVHESLPAFSIDEATFQVLSTAYTAHGPGVSVAVSHLQPSERDVLGASALPRRSFLLADPRDGSDVARLVENALNSNNLLAGMQEVDLPMLHDQFGGAFEAACATDDGSAAYFTWSYARAGDYVTGDVFANGWQRGHTPAAAVVRVALPDLNDVKVLRLDNELDDPCAVSCYDDHVVVGVRRPHYADGTRVLLVGEGSDGDLTVFDERSIPHTACTLAATSEEPISGDAFAVVVGAREDSINPGEFIARLTSIKLGEDESGAPVFDISGSGESLEGIKSYNLPGAFGIAGQDVFRTGAVLDQVGFFLATSPVTGSDADLAAKVVTIPGWAVNARLAQAELFSFASALNPTPLGVAPEDAVAVKNLAFGAVSEERHLYFVAGVTLNDNPCASAERAPANDDDNPLGIVYDTDDCRVSPYINDFTGFVDVLLMRIDSITPDLQPATGGSFVTVRGQGFRPSPTLSVRIKRMADDALMATYAARYVSDWEITYRSSIALPTDSYYVQVSLDGQHFTEAPDDLVDASAFKTYPNPVISKLEPDSGPFETELVVVVDGCGMSKIRTIVGNREEDVKCRATFVHYTDSNNDGIVDDNDGGTYELGESVVFDAEPVLDPTHINDGRFLRCYSPAISTIGPRTLEVSLNNGHDYTQAAKIFRYVGVPTAVELVSAANQEHVSDAVVKLQSIGVRIVDNSGSTVKVADGRQVVACEWTKAGACRTSVTGDPDDWCHSVVGDRTYCFHYLKRATSAEDVENGHDSQFIMPVVDGEGTALFTNLYIRYPKVTLGPDDDDYELRFVSVGLESSAPVSVSFSVGSPHFVRFDKPAASIPVAWMRAILDDSVGGVDVDKVIVKLADDIVYVNSEKEDFTLDVIHLRVYDISENPLKSADTNEWSVELEVARADGAASDAASGAVTTMRNGEVTWDEVSLEAPSAGLYWVKATACLVDVEAGEVTDNCLPPAKLDVYIVPGKPQSLHIVDTNPDEDTRVDAHGNFYEEPMALQSADRVSVSDIVLQIFDAGGNDMMASFDEESDFFPVLQMEQGAIHDRYNDVLNATRSGPFRLVARDRFGVSSGSEVTFFVDQQDNDRIIATDIVLLSPQVSSSPYELSFTHPLLEPASLPVEILPGEAAQVAASFSFPDEVDPGRRVQAVATPCPVHMPFDQFAIPAENVVCLPTVEVGVQDSAGNDANDPTARTFTATLVPNRDARIPTTSLLEHSAYSEVRILAANITEEQASGNFLRCHGTASLDCLTATSIDGVARFEGLVLTAPSPGLQALSFVEVPDCGPSSNPEDSGNPNWCMLTAFNLPINIDAGPPAAVIPLTDVEFVEEDPGTGASRFVGPVLAIVDEVGNLVNVTGVAFEVDITGVGRLLNKDLMSDAIPESSQTVAISEQGWTVFTHITLRGEKEARYALSIEDTEGLGLELNSQHVAEYDLDLVTLECGDNAQPTPGDTECRCDAGYQASGNPIEPCIECREDQFNQYPGELCEPCPDKMSTLGLTARTSRDSCFCTEGYYLDPTMENLDDACKVCPMGYLDVFKNKTVVDTANPASECRPLLILANSTQRVSIVTPHNITIRPGWWRSKPSSLLFHKCELKPIEAQLNPPDEEDEEMCLDVPHFRTPDNVDAADASWFPDTYYYDPRTDERSTIPPECAQCTGGRAGGDDLCGKQYSGPLCNNCAAGYGKNGKFCSRCPADTATNTGIIATVMLVVACVVAGMVWTTIRAGTLIQRNMVKKIKEAKQQLRERKRRGMYGYGSPSGMHHSLKEDVNAQLKGTLLVKIAMNYAQLTSMSADVDIEWPRMVQSLFTAQETLSTPQLQIASVDCALAGRGGHTDDLFFSKWIMYMSLPVLSVVMPLVFWSIIGAVNHCLTLRRVTKERRLRVRSNAGDAAAAESLAAAYERKADRLRKHNLSHYLDMYTVSVLVILFLVHSTVTKQVLLMWSCRPLDRLPTGEFEQFLNADLGVPCGTDKHKSYSAAAGFFLVVYSLGIPLMGIFILSRNIKAIRYQWVAQEDPFFDTVLHSRKLMATSRFGFLFKGFEHRAICPYWEVGPVMLRKVFMVFMTVLLADMEPQIRMLFGILLVTFAVLLHVKYAPFDDDDLDYLELVSLITSFMTLFLGLFFVVPGVPPSWKSPIALFIIGLNVIAGCMAVYSMSKVAVQLHAEIKSRKAKIAARKKRIKRQWRRAMIMSIAGATPTKKLLPKDDDRSRADKLKQAFGDTHKLAYEQAMKGVKAGEGVLWSLAAVGHSGAVHTQSATRTVLSKVLPCLVSRHVAPNALEEEKAAAVTSPATQARQAFGGSAASGGSMGSSRKVDPLMPNVSTRINGRLNMSLMDDARRETFRLQKQREQEAADEAAAEAELAEEEGVAIAKKTTSAAATPSAIKATVETPVTAFEAVMEDTESDEDDNGGSQVAGSGGKASGGAGGKRASESKAKDDEGDGDSADDAVQSLVRESERGLQTHSGSGFLEPLGTVG